MERPSLASTAGADPRQEESLAPSAEPGIKPYYAVLAFDALPVRLLEAGGARAASLLFCLAIDFDGGKDILGVWPGADMASGWSTAVAALRARGLTGAQMAIGDLQTELGAALEEHLPGTPRYQNLHALFRRALPLVEIKRRKVLKSALLDALAASCGDEADARIRRLPATGFTAAADIWMRSRPDLEPHFALPACAKRFLLKFDAATSLKEKLVRRAVRLPQFWRSEQQALEDTKALLRHVGEGWKVAPRLWLGLSSYLWNERREPSPATGRGRNRPSTNGQSHSTFV